MFDLVVDISLIFITMAFVGYLIMQAYNWGSNFGFPKTNMSNTEFIFQHVSVAVLGMCSIVVFLNLSLAAPNQNTVFTDFSKGVVGVVQYMETNQLVDPGTYNSMIKYLSLAFLASGVYMFAFLVSMFLGIIMRYSLSRWIKVTMKNGQQEIYPRIINENEQFFFVEDTKFGNYWKTIRKEEITAIELVDHASKFNGYIKDVRLLWKKSKWDCIFKVFYDNAILIMMLILCGPAIIGIIFH